MKMTGLLMMVTGLLIRYWVGRRKFKRRNNYGREMFSSYEQGMFIRFLEFLVFWSGSALFLAGLLYLIANG